MPNFDATALRVEMTRCGVQQLDIARLLKISPSQVTKRMSGEIDWRIGELRAVAELLSVPLSLLVPDEVPPISAPPPRHSETSSRADVVADHLERPVEQVGARR